MAIAAADALNAGTYVPVPFKRPPGFPRGELLCENSEGRRVYRYNPLRILAWLAANGSSKYRRRVK